VELGVLCGGGQGSVSTAHFVKGYFREILSLLLFCLSIAPILHTLRKLEGFTVCHVDSPMKHMFFMNDLKVHAKSSGALQTLGIVDRVLCAVGMELGLRKCAVAHVICGKYISGENYLLPEKQRVKCVILGSSF